MAPGFIVQLPAGKPDKSTLPVAKEQVVCVIAPTVGAEGITGCELIITLADAGEVHPDALVTVYVYVPDTIPETVTLAPDPEMDPGFIVQAPAGNAESTTLPDANEQVGCVIAPTIGAAGVIGCTLITTLADAAETHPAELVTVKLYVPVAKPVIVLLVPPPTIAPGLIVQVPVGKPLSTTLPVDSKHVG